MNIKKMLRSLFGLTRSTTPTRRAMPEDIIDPDNKEFMGTCNGEPMTFRGLNERLEAYYLRQREGEATIKAANENAKIIHPIR
jgi:hypothetical protein